MCDFNCSAGLGVTAGVLGVLMTIVCCKTFCSVLVEMTQPADTEAETPSQNQRPVAVATPTLPQTTIIEMPIVIHIYLPQVQGAAVQPHEERPETKNEYDPLPV